MKQEPYEAGEEQDSKYGLLQEEGERPWGTFSDRALQTEVCVCVCVGGRALRRPPSVVDMVVQVEVLVVEV